MRALITCLSLISSSYLSATEFVIGDLMGQLGNQLFIIATAVSLALDNHAIPLFPSLVTETGFNIPLNHEKVFHDLETSKPVEPIQYYYIEPHYHYEPIPYRPNMLIRGWFQSEKYFLHHKREILHLFSPRSEIQEYLTRKYAWILHHPNTVSIHFRSYQTEDPNHKVYAKCEMEYFEKAIALFPADTLFVVFSNHMEWCRENFSTLPYQFYFVEGETHYHDLYLMSMCKHHIICNSSFSWWGAYLNPNPDKTVVAPADWFTPEYSVGRDQKDLIPPGWITL